jgi:GNAT superfamily N-acetyltransferase
MEEDGRATASAGLLLVEWPPHVKHPSSAVRGYVLNVFVQEEWRRQGLARALMESCLAEARRRGIEVVTLHASDKGRPLYEGMGFEASNEMVMRVDEA